MGSERPSDSRGAWPPPSTSRYRSKACLGAMFHAKSFEDAGAPPICVGFSYRKTAPMPPTDPAAAHGAFKFTCVGYGQRAIEDPADRAGRHLPYCEGLQILVADATHTGRPASGDRRLPLDPAAAAALVRDLEALRRRRDDAVIALREAAARFPGDRDAIARLEKHAREREMARRARVAEARDAAGEEKKKRASDERNRRGATRRRRPRPKTKSRRLLPTARVLPWPSSCARRAARPPRRRAACAVCWRATRAPAFCFRAPSLRTSSQRARGRF